jgi:hypothetical protein
MALAAAPPAYAGYFTGVPVDGPSADIDSVGGVALARDGGGQVVYLKDDHVYVSLLANGAPRQPQQIDSGQSGASSQPRIAVSDGGRALAVWVNGGSLYGALRTDGGSPWGAPQLIFDGSSGDPAVAPSLSMSTHGAGYVAFQVGGDVRTARLSGATWTLVDQPLDVDPARVAADPDISASADGTAVATFTERGGDGVGHVYVRRVIRTRLSDVPREAGVATIDGFPGGSADSAEVDVEDDSSYAWVVFRQDIGGVSRILSRRLVGSQLQPPVTVDSNVGGGEQPSFDMTGKGRGLTALGITGSGQTYGAPLNSGDKWGAGSLLGGVSGAPPLPVAAIAENARGTVAWRQVSGGGAPTIVARYWNARFWEQVTNLAAPEFGTPDAGRGLYASGDGSGNAAIAFVQGDGADRRVVVAVYDKDPRTTAGSNRSTWTTDQRPSFKWSKIDDSWGSIQYQLEIDGIVVSTQSHTSWKPPQNLPDGAHVWNVIAVDSRGQATEGPDRTFRIDTARPVASLDGSSRVKKGKPVGAVLSATDGDAITGSGIATATINYGDGTGGALTVPKIGLIEDFELGHRYSKPGQKTIRIVLKDRAGNETVVKKLVRVTK